MKLYFSHHFTIDEEEWSEIFLLPFKVTLESKIQAFQWKLTHNLIYTNIRLHKMNPPRSRSSLCSFCEQAEETVMHLFVECESIQCIWNGFILLWGSPTEAPRKFSAKQILLGDPS